MKDRIVLAAKRPAADMSMRFYRFVRLACVPFALIALLLVSYSCRRKGPVPFPELGEAKQAAGAGIEVRAQLLPGREEIKRQFKWYLPDSNVVPLQVTMRNNDVVPLTVYYRDDILRDELYGGFELVVDGRSERPLHPVGVIKRKMHTDKHVSYRFSTSGVILSASVLPPLGGYFLYRELKVGRYYRPLFKHSFYRAVSSGMLVPRTLEPGETAQGYLYFPVDDANPYASPHGGDTPVTPPDDGAAVGAESADTDVEPPPITLDRTFELTVQTYRPPVFEDTIIVRDVIFLRRAAAPEAHEMESRDYILFLALRESSGGVSFDLGSIETPLGDIKHSFHEIASFRSDDARIADAVSSGSTVACAINFKGKSRVYILTAESGDVHVGEQMLLPRRTIHLSIVGDVLFAVTADDFCRAISLKDYKIRRHVRLGSDVRDAALGGDRLFVLDGRRGVMVYGTAGEHLLKEIDRYPLPGDGDMEIIGSDAGSGIMAYLCRGSKGAGDTITVGMPGRDAGSAEHVQLPLPAGVKVYYMTGTDIFFQLEGGLFVKCDLEPIVKAWAGITGGDPDEKKISGAAVAPENIIHQAVFLPVILRALMQDGAGIIGIGENGAVVRGGLADFAPEPGDAKISRCAVTVAPRIPEE